MTTPTGGPEGDGPEGGPGGGGVTDKEDMEAADGEGELRTSDPGATSGFESGCSWWGCTGDRC